MTENTGHNLTPHGGPAQILTSDLDDITAYAAALDHADIIVERA
jgi:hypothetical protein